MKRFIVRSGNEANRYFSFQITIMLSITIRRFALACCVLFSAVPLNAQCSDCTSLEEALKDPLKVRHLDLSNKGLTEVPKEVDQLVNLETLDLSHNLIAEVHLSTVFNNLHHLDLGGNPLLNPWKLDLIGKAFPHVVRLELNNCKLALLPTGLDFFPDITILDLSDNELTFVPEGLEQLTQLSMLDLSGNRLTSVKYVLGTLWNLSSLAVSGNPGIDLGEVLLSLSGNKNLYYLDIDAQQLSKEAEKHLKTLPVERIAINGLTGNIPASLISNSSVNELTFSGGILTNDACRQLGAMKQLSRLTLDDMEISPVFTKLFQLDELKIAGNQPGMSLLSSLTFLDQLDLTATTVTAKEAESLARKLPTTAVIASGTTILPEFAANTVAPIAAPETVTQVIPGTEQSLVTVADVQFAVPANAFLTESGESYTGNVSLAVKIYDDALDIALDGAPMTFTENGRTETFTSSGMVDIRATAENGQSLKANPANPIEMAMPDRRPENNSDLFYYNEPLNQWFRDRQVPLASAYDSIITPIIDSINRMELNEFINYQCIPRLYSMKVRKKRLDPSELTFNSYRGRKRIFSNRKSRNQVLQYSTNRSGRLIARTHWKIDTIVTPELIGLLKEIRSSYQVRLNDPKLKGRYDSQPRIIRDLHVAADFTRDHYRMTFRYKDSVISLPVYIATSGTKKNALVMKEHATFEKRLRAALRQDEKEKIQGQKLRQAKAERFGEQNRAAAIALAQASLRSSMNINFPVRQYRNRLFFVKILALGLINCDAFYRPQEIEPDIYELEDILVDQHGATFEKPETVRTVYKEQNAYVLSPSDKIPDYKNISTIIIVPLDKTTIGIASLGSIDKKIKKIRSIDIEGKTSAEVQRLILN